jgi:putative phage-type endonuclease
MSAPAAVMTLPGSEQVLPPDPDRDEWLEARREGIGGSDASTVLGLNKFSSPVRVWLDKTDRVDEDSDEPPNEPALWGTLLEPVVRDEWSRRTGITVAAAGMQRSLVNPFMLYSPDGVTNDGGLYEGKTCSLWRRDEWGNEQAPDHAELQVQHGMAVTGLPHAWIAGLIGGQTLVWRRIERDEALIADLVAFERDWWESYVVADEMPPLDDTEATNEVIREMYATAHAGKAIEITADILDAFRHLREAKERLRMAEAEVTGWDSKLRHLIGDAELVVRDLTAPIDDTKAGKANILATFGQTGQMSKSAFTAAYPDLAAACSKTTEVLDLDAVKSKHPEQYAAHRGRVLRPRKTLDSMIDDTPGSK